MDEFRFVMHYDLEGKEDIYLAHRIIHKGETLYVVVWGEKKARRESFVYSEKEVIDSIERRSWIILRD